MLEIERKFLVKNDDFKKEDYRVKTISQGYLCKDPDRTIRIRIKDDEGFVTIKGKTSETGMSRFEWEKKIDLEEAKILLSMCHFGIIEKHRFEIKKGKHVYEVDEFFGANNGLIVAEIELLSEEESFEKPDWLGQEVTLDHRYANSSLSNIPYSEWEIKD